MRSVRSRPVAFAAERLFFSSGRLIAHGHRGRRSDTVACPARRGCLAPVAFPGAAIWGCETSRANASYDGYHTAPINLDSAGRNRLGALFPRKVVMRRAGIALIPFARHAYSVRHLVQLFLRVREHVAHQHMTESVDGLVDVHAHLYKSHSVARKSGQLKKWWSPRGPHHSCSSATI